MAGAGYRLFNTGDVLTAAQVNTYLQEQVVMVFANATARTTALSGVLAEGMMSYLQDTNAVEVYNGSSWVNVGNSGDITEVTAGTGLSGGGTSGAVTLTNAMATAIDAKADLIVGTGDNTFSRLAVGTNGHVLTADSTVSPTGLKWAAPAAGGGLTLLNTGGTSLAGSVSTTVSSISGAYKNLHIYVDAAYVASNLDALGLRINTESGANTYHEIRIERYGTTTATNGTTGSTIYLTAVCGNTDTGNFFYGMIPNYADTSHRKTIQGQAYYKHDSTNSFQIWGGARVNSNDAVTDITIVNLGGNNISGGTLFIYGEN